MISIHALHPRAVYKSFRTTQFVRSVQYNILLCVCLCVCIWVCVSLYARLSEQTNVDRSNLNDGGGLQLPLQRAARVSWVTLIDVKSERAVSMGRETRGGDGGMEDPGDRKSADIQKDKNVSILYYCCTIRPSAHGFYCLCAHTLYIAPI